MPSGTGVERTTQHVDDLTVRPLAETGAGTGFVPPDPGGCIVSPGAATGSGLTPMGRASAADPMAGNGFEGATGPLRRSHAAAGATRALQPGAAGVGVVSALRRTAILGDSRAVHAVDLARAGIHRPSLRRTIRRNGVSKLKERFEGGAQQQPQALGGQGAQEAQAMAGSVASRVRGQIESGGMAPSGPVGGDKDKGASGVTGTVASRIKGEKEKQIRKEQGGPQDIDPQTQKEAFLLAKLMNEYATEQTTVRPGLMGALTSLATAVKNNWKNLKDLEALDPSNTAGLTAIKNRYISNIELYPVIKDLALLQTIVKVKKRHADLYEQARREEIPVSKEGVLDMAAVGARMVEYDTAADAQEKTKILISGGRFYRNNAKKDLADTSKGVTHHSGLGVEIFVVGPTGEIHMAPHKIGKYHHSSLLAGGEVSMGGEMKVTQGKIDWISNKSGHYNPSEKHFLQFLNFLEQDKVPLDFQVQGWGVPQGLTARKFLDGYVDPTNRDVKKSFEFVKTFTIWDSFVREFGQGPVQNAVTTEGWTPNATLDGMQDASGHPVPEPRVRQVLETKLGKKAKVKVVQVGGADTWK